MYAIFKALGKQFRAEKGATLKLPFMDGKEAGDTLTFTDVLLASNGDTITAGAPTIAVVEDEPYALMTAPRGHVAVLQAQSLDQLTVETVATAANSLLPR